MASSQIDPVVLEAKNKRRQLLAHAESFCNAFAAKAPPDKIFEHFSKQREKEIVVVEHGLSSLAPFLGREFKGLEGAQEYFKIIGSCLSYENMTFDNFIVDVVENRVSTRGAARFTWKNTAQGWDEVFTYQLEFDDEGKVVRYEIWADSGAAYLAKKRVLIKEILEAAIEHGQPGLVKIGF